MSTIAKRFTFVESQKVRFEWTSSHSAEADKVIRSRLHGDVAYRRIGTFSLVSDKTHLIACENFYPAEPISFESTMREDRLWQLAAVSNLLHRLAESGHPHPLNSQLSAAIIEESLYWNPPQTTFSADRAALVQIFESNDVNRNFLLSLVPAGTHPSQWSDETVSLVRDQLMELDDEAADGAYPYPYHPKAAMGEPFAILERSFHDEKFG